MSDDPPSPPEIGKHILVGINSVTRHLEMLAAGSAPATMPSAVPTTENSTADEIASTKEKDVLRPLSMVIITHPKPCASTAHAHLPTLVHLSTLQPPSSDAASTPSIPQATRLIPLATSTDARLASNLHIPRVGALAIFSDAPGAKSLEAFVRGKVGITSCPFIDEALAAKWRGINVKNEGGGAQAKLKVTTAQKKPRSDGEQTAERK